MNKKRILVYTKSGVKVCFIRGGRSATTNYVFVVGKDVNDV